MVCAPSRVTGALLLLLMATASAADTAFVVTDVKVVEATSDYGAKNQCEQTLGSTWLHASVDAAVGAPNAYMRICQQLQPAAVVGGSSSSSDRVLRRVAVFDDRAACPAPFEKLYSPRDNVVVCLQYYAGGDSARRAVRNKRYISSLMATKQRNYNNAVPGWATDPVSLHVARAADKPTYSGLFLSWRRPVVPISDVRIVEALDERQVYAACDDLGDSWDQAGSGFVDVAGFDGVKSVLCAQRTGDGAGRALVAVQLVKDPFQCMVSGQTPLPLIGNVFTDADVQYVCTKYGNGNAANNGVFVGDLALQRINATTTATPPVADDLIPGSWTLLSGDLNSNSAGANAYLLARATKPHTFVVPPPKADKAPLTAVAANDSATLSFKILQLADLHFTGNPAFPCRDPPSYMAAGACNESVMSQFIEDLLDVEKPDFVVFTGDNVQTYAPNLHPVAVDAFTKGVEARGIPWALVFGNHDDENAFSREQIFAVAAAKPHCYATHGPADVDGVGNYELAVQAPVGGAWGNHGDAVFRMYFLDSHGYPDQATYPQVQSTYDWVKQSQIDYYRQLANAHASSANLVPSLMFFHIPLVEYGFENDVTRTGETYEAVSSPDVNTNLFAALVDVGDVKATFVGHDHVNEYCYLREGVQLCYGGGAGFGLAYGGTAFARRARVIEWTLDGANKRTIRSWKRHHDDLATKASEQVLYSEA